MKYINPTYVCIGYGDKEGQCIAFSELRSHYCSKCESEKYRQTELARVTSRLARRK